ncbi:MAG: NAD(P)H-hydrate epimerase [Chloroflexota bacterium]
MLSTSTRLDVAGIPAATVAEMIEIDRLAVESFGISLPQMMELAGLALARTAADIRETLEDAQLTVLVGPGNNGGGGLVAARHIANRGARVRVILARPVAQLTAIARERVATLVEMRIPVCVSPWDLADGELDTELRGSDLIIDALLGYSARGPARGEIAQLIPRVIASGTPVLSLDLPSGIDPDGGDDGRNDDGVMIDAAATMAVALPKRGIAAADGRRRAGTIYLADIGLPAELYRRAGLQFADPFADGLVVRLA